MPVTLPHGPVGWSWHFGNSPRNFVTLTLHFALCIFHFSFHNDKGLRPPTEPFTYRRRSQICRPTRIYPPFPLSNPVGRQIGEICVPSPSLVFSSTPRPLPGGRSRRVAPNECNIWAKCYIGRGRGAQRDQRDTQQEIRGRTG